MIYLSTTHSNTVNVTVGDMATLYTATYSVSNEKFTYSGQLPLLTFTGKVSAVYTFYTTNIALEDNGNLVQETDYNKLTELVPGDPIQGVVLEAKAPTPVGNPDTLWIHISGLNGLWPQYIVVEAGDPIPPTIVTYALTQSFIWSIQDQDTKIVYTFSNNDISDNIGYYNSFSFSVVTGATYGLTAGIIPAPSGNFIYNVYQTQYNGSLTPISNSLEVGLLVINGTYSNPITNITGDNDTIKVDKNIN